ncbi:MAG TPA: Rieske 2Fe-2S domain-containing protein [Candidatus Limnocylindria bacterium]|nr:Rieske 2Fe-2S domain-containing protein [Candidatus Limnocylindria bacterium]
MIRPSAVDHARLHRRQLLRIGFGAAVALGIAELAAAIAPYLRVTRVIGLGAPVAVGTAKDILAEFARTDDRPILFREGRFFLLHAPGGIIAAYRKCTHLGCTVPFSYARDLFECPCHGSRYDKRTAVVLKAPAPKPLQLFHITESPTGVLIVDTNPLNVIDRGQEWDDRYLEIRE